MNDKDAGELEIPVSGVPWAESGPMPREKMCMPLIRPLTGMEPPLGRVTAWTVLPDVMGTAA